MPAAPASLHRSRLPEQVRTAVIFRAAFIGLVLLAAAAFYPPTAFSAITSDNPVSNPAYWISESGGKYGTAAILLVTCGFYARFMMGKRAKAKAFFLTLTKLLIVIGLVAAFNEHVIKHALKLPRPSHQYVLARDSRKLSKAEFYAKDGAARGAALREIMDRETKAFRGVNPHVLDHWCIETGYSFPSGHSFNGFLLAFILSFSLRFSRSRTARKIFLLPLIWAVLVALSRVALGAHTPWDVSLGAATGTLTGLILMYYDLLRRNLLHRDHKSPQ